MSKQGLRSAVLLPLLGPLALAIAGCEGNMQEPWVSSPEQLREERARSEEQSVQLRERMALVQTDR